MDGSPEQIAQAVERLRSGGLVAFPTETVYGLGADAFSEEAVRKVFAAKGRPAHNPLIVHVSGEEMAKSVAAEWPEDAKKLARKFWPGPLSIVVPKVSTLPDVVTGSGPNVAVRCPAHPLTLALLEAFGSGLVGPSANISGFVSPTTAAHVRDAFDERDVLVLDGGSCTGGIESTVVSVVGGSARVLRSGLIDAALIGEVLGRNVECADSGVIRASPTASTPAEAPGQLGSHYAPRTKAIMVDADEVEKVVNGVRGVCVVMTHQSEADSPFPEPLPSGERLQKSPTPKPPPSGRGIQRAHVLRMPADARGYARRLYAALREADALHGELIVIVTPPDESKNPVWRAVRDRLKRATSER
ncbi:MAG: threonylcarbamoyl-AMP synthase [Phycisphaeraceae bacterium]|nr:threonylcarbamoyl-AMP synthase [Phycisphaeraceae bacterium]